MATQQSKLVLTAVDRITGPIRGITAQMAALQARTRAAMSPMLGMTARFAALGAGYVGVTAGLRGTLGAAVKFEEAFADVRKVVTASDEQFANMSRTIKKMSTELPLTAVDIAALFAAAGESDIPINELNSFADMAAKVGIAFDMSAGQAGESLAKLKAQLGLTVAETGDMADAINHLSNNMASKAPEIVDYMLRVGKFAEMGGFHRDQIAAIGSAMISAGAEADKAGTAMMNVVRKMTIGGFAKKAQADAAKVLGLDLPTIAKQMQKDAPKALKTVLKAIAKQPKYNQVALLSQFFGDEARAFAPLVGNIGLLDQALDSVSDKTKYAGSAFREYVQRANTASNALQLLRNKIAFVFEGVGEKWLPTLKEGIKGISDVLDSLGERVSIFDKIGTALKGFANGLGFDSGIRDFMNAMGDLLLGKADGSNAAEALGRVFKTFQDLGKSVREFGDTYKDNALVKFLGEVSGYGFTLFAASIGFGLMAGAITKLAKALFLISGAKAALSILTGIAGIGGALFGAAGGGKGAPKDSKKPGTKLPNTKEVATGGAILSGLGAVVAGSAIVAGIAAAIAAFGPDVVKKARKPNKGEPLDWLGLDPTESREDRLDRLNQRPVRSGPTSRGWDRGDGREATVAPAAAAPVPFSFGQMFKDLMKPIGGKDGEVSIRALPPITGSVVTQPSGIQQVMVTNQQRPNVSMPITVYMQGSDPGAVADAIGARVKSTMEGYFSDGGIGSN